MAADREIEEFKHQQLWCAVMEPPWETSLAWADAQTDLPTSDPSETDGLVIRALLELLDEGLVYYYEAEDFGPTFSREVSEADGLPREKVVAVLSDGSEQLGDGRITAPWLLMRATAKGLEYHFQLRPEDRTRWEEWQREGEATEAPPHSET